MEFPVFFISKLGGGGGGGREEEWDKVGLYMKHAYFQPTINLIVSNFCLT